MGNKNISIKWNRKYIKVQQLWVKKKKALVGINESGVENRNASVLFAQWETWCSKN
jgi:hypothetical protein